MFNHHFTTKIGFGYQIYCHRIANLVDIIYCLVNCVGSIRLQYFNNRLCFVAAIIIEIVGVAKTSWTETESVRQNSGDTANETVTFTATEEYFSNKYNVAGGPNSKCSITDIL